MSVCVMMVAKQCKKTVNMMLQWVFQKCCKVRESVLGEEYAKTANCYKCIVTVMKHRGGYDGGI